MSSDDDEPLLTTDGAKALLAAPWLGRLTEFVVGGERAAWQLLHEGTTNNPRLCARARVELG